MKKTLKSAVAVMLAVAMVFGGAPAGVLEELDLNWPEWLKSPFSFGASAAGDVWDGSVASGFTSGSGMDADPYIIETAAQLAYLSSSVNSGTTYSGKYIKLVNDIVLNSSDVFAYDGEGNITGKAEGKTPNEWTAIGGTEENGFEGTFDGDDHTVSGIFIETENNFQGLFGFVSGGTIIKNVGIVGSYIKGGNDVGGVVGENLGIVSNCYNMGIVTGSRNIGGLVGQNFIGTVSNCYNTGSVTGSEVVGGVVGHSKIGYVNYCYNTGCVTGSNYSVGGVAGYNYWNTITNCCNTGIVTGSEVVGGVAGQNNKGTVINCYNTGSVTGSEVVGGVAGRNNTRSVSNCYYLYGTASGGIEGSDISGQAEVLTDAQMRIQTSFVDWDFETVWTIYGDPDYPYPELQGVIHVSEPVKSVTISYDNIEIPVGGTRQLTATVLPLNATNKSVTWTSSDTNVATADTNGLVTAISTGTATITVTANDTTNGTLTDACLVKVTPVMLDKIEIKTPPVKTNYYVGDTFDTTGLTLTATYNNGNTETITAGFTCEPTVLHPSGTKAITVTYGGKTCTFEVTVDVLTSIEIKTLPDKTIYFIGDALDTTGLTLTAWYSNGHTETVSSGFCCLQTTLDTIGTQEVTVFYSGENGGDLCGEFCTFEVTVLPVPVSRVTLSSATLALRYSETAKLTAMITPVNATNKNVTWTSSNEQVAIVDAKGNVTAKGTGTATITATSADVGYTAQCTVTVKLAWWQWLIKIILLGWIWY